MSETVDISKIEDRQVIVDTLLSDIDDWCVKEFDDGHRTHLGASQIGKPCSRQLWYIFRWAKKEEFGSNSSRPAGQTLRLFNRGHREENAILKYLEGIGCKFQATSEVQIKVSAVGGHFGGSLDNVGYLPERYGIAEKILFEFKTANMAQFNQLKKNGLKTNKPEHYSQMCTYGVLAGIRFGLYLCVDKNTDEIYMELVELDEDHGKAMIDKAGMIISAEQSPPKIALTPTNFACKWCNFANICHHGEPVEKNCRSCDNAKPAEGKKWLCSLAPEGSQVIPDTVIPVGCNSYRPIHQV